MENLPSSMLTQIYVVAKHCLIAMRWIFELGCWNLDVGALFAIEGVVVRVIDGW